MNTRDFILVGAGAVVGYLLVGVMNKKNSVSSEAKGEVSLPDKSSQTVPPSAMGEKDTTTGTPAPVLYGSNKKQVRPPKQKETIADPNLATCNENWSKYSQNKRFSSQEAKQSTYDKFIETCLVRAL